ncbi:MULTISPECIES: radical SAM protein [Psychrilyobacter]|uniref:Radical SAM protein n=1 Tax=Psychrilyobacter piezotolerans TaxID=2293438 RepID=A0ABX9KF93_9FUSO|nr:MULTISPECIES: radical SAM protein [Psychrilyobacter]MCS5422563.1 B12-binding domain-containing radical SAM protein [Psychrilyobacter sp. S5]NDI78683.1 B12-binding domain-containing radical SAM protein [Psychrilyobacter piezotolerans]RDE59861.1 radical SAM protein [Psychrilyobacter sp. S5]REI40142.1 radical SAM protein [Psychrilyobacter piezotolerans]
MPYEGAIYRPPSEANSLILQVTVGCSHNRCTFCSMYKDKSFRMKSKEEIFDDIDTYTNDFYTKAFLADGDAMLLPTGLLIEIIRRIRAKMPKIKRIGIYAHANNLKTKSVEELKSLREEGLNIVYVGIESGSDKILEKINKGITSGEMEKELMKISESGIKLSIMIISGLGGKELTHEHAVESAKLLSRVKPKFLSLLTLMLEEGTQFYNDVKNNKVELLNPEEILLETKLLIENLELNNTIFRVNHASNYLSLEGVLNRDKERILEEINTAVRDKDYIPEYFRRL